MPPARRTSTRTRGRLPQSQSLHGPSGIQRYTRASKPGVASGLLVDGKEEAKKTLTASATTPCLLTASPSKKRKLNEIARGGHEEDTPVPLRSVEDTPSKTLKFSGLTVSTPRTSRTRSSRSVSRPASLVSSSSSVPSTRATSPPTSPSRGRSSPSPERRPSSFNDLLELHASFLKAISLHFAHNGTTTPADLRELLPSMEKIWRKRKVVVKDLQRIVRVWEDDTSRPGPRFRIVNYGLGKVCLERPSHHASSDGRSPVNRFDENELQAIFAELVEARWRKISSSVDENSAGEDFVERLALAPIHDSLTAFNALRKGQQRLQDLKGGVIKVKTAMLKARDNGTAEVKTREATTDRRRGLLDRIKSKELLQSKLPPLPTKEELIRRSAADRVEDVARVLALLRPSSSIRNGMVASHKKPYGFDAIIQNIQDSLRSPICREEVAACLDILGRKDIAGDWINIVTVNQLRSVVLKSGHDVSPQDIGAKVSKIKI